MNEQIKRRLSELEKQHPRISEYSDLLVTMKTGEQKTMCLSELLELEASDIEKLESENADLLILANMIMMIDIEL